MLGLRNAPLLLGNGCYDIERTSIKIEILHHTDPATTVNTGGEGYQWAIEYFCYL